MASQVFGWLRPEDPFRQRQQQIADAAKLEKLIFDSFPQIGPDKDMPIAIDEWWNGIVWEPCNGRYDNDGARAVVLALNWAPWNEVFGFRLMSLPESFRVISSVKALSYYLPAFMLHYLYFRDQSHVGAEVMELFMPPDDAEICRAFSAYMGGEDGGSTDRFSLDRFAALHASMSDVKRHACVEFIRFWMTWEWRGEDRIDSREAYAKLLARWTG